MLIAQLPLNVLNFVGKFLYFNPIMSEFVGPELLVIDYLALHDLNKRASVMSVGVCMK